MQVGNAIVGVDIGGPAGVTVDLQEMLHALRVFQKDVDLVPDVKPKEKLGNRWCRLRCLRVWLIMHQETITTQVVPALGHVGYSAAFKAKYKHAF